MFVAPLPQPSKDAASPDCFLYHVAEQLSQGTLQILLAHDEHSAVPLHLISPQGRLAVPKVRAFVDFAVPRLKAHFFRLAERCPEATTRHSDRVAKKYLPTSGYWRRYLVGLRHAPDRHLQSKGVTMTTTFGSAKWQGRIWDGEGAISTKSGALTDYPYGFGSRFEDKPGSNPRKS